MNLAEFDLINEEFYTSEVSPIQLDFLLAEGWRHFGQHFYRYNLGFLKNEFRFVIPLRIRLAGFKFSRSQRRVINKNKDLRSIIRPIEFTDEKHALFKQHKMRFDHGIPENIYSFLDKEAATIPCPALEFCIYDKDKLLAVSFLDTGEKSVSSIYAMFAPEEAKRSLGIFTMLLEIQYAIENNKKFYYQGYAYEGESFYDYKKRFSALEFYDWYGDWKEYKLKIKI
jgi:arginine-tRNA-protein transferase